MDIEAIFKALDRHRVRYVLVGGLGAVAHGARIETNDVDLCNACDPHNLKQIAAVLLEMHAILIREPPGRATSSINLNNWRTLRMDDPHEHHLFATPFGQIDVLPHPFGGLGSVSTTGYAKLILDATVVTAFGLHIRVAPFDTIMSSKLALGRKQDIAAEAELRRVRRLIRQGTKPDFGLEQFAALRSQRPNNNPTPNT